LYTKEFIEKVKAEYPDRKDIHRMLDMGDIRVGNELAKKIHLDIDDAEIIRALDEGRYEDVKKAAEKRIRLKQLYAEWRNLQAEWCRIRFVVNG